MAKFKDFYFNNKGLLENINAVQPFCVTGGWYSRIDKKALDNYLLLHIGNREVVTVLYPEENHSLAIMSDILKAYEFKLNGLLETTERENDYDFLDNKNRHFTRNENSTMTYGDTDTTTVNGQRKQTNVIADRTNGETLGGGTDTNNRTLVYDDTKQTEKVNKGGQSNDKVVNSQHVSPFDSADYDKASIKDESTTTYGERENEVTTEGRTDTDNTSVTIASRTNSQSIGGGTDTITQDSVTDTNKVERGNDTVGVIVTENEHGNIGVTTTGQLMEDSRKLIHDFNFFEEVEGVILHEFAKTFLWE